MVRYLLDTNILSDLLRNPNDLLIAAHALALDLTLVTDNVDEFARVPGLALENWLKSPTRT
jgi:predicted nucleic acid-binding protein